MRTFHLQRDEDETGISGTGKVAEGSCIEDYSMPDRDGYPRVWRNGKTVRKSRALWEDTNGPIPDGLLMLHRCDNPPCINPEHLYLGTHADNARDREERGRGAGGPRNAAKTCCPQGHEYTPENTFINRKGSRVCRTCQRESNKRWYATRGKEARRAHRSAISG